MAPSGCPASFLDVGMAKPKLPDGPVPLHHQLANHLRAVISRSRPGARLASDFGLVQVHGVSRTTVRRAIQTLVVEGLVVRRKGLGTFVATRRIAQPLDNVWAFVETFTEHGLHPTSELAIFNWIDDASLLPAELTSLQKGALMLRRLYKVDDVPYAVADAYIPYPFGQELSRADIERHPTFQILQDRSHVRLQHARVTLRGSAASAAVAEALAIRQGAPLLVLRRWLHDIEGTLVQYSIHHLPADKFEFSLEPSLSGERHVAYSFGQPITRLSIAVNPPTDLPVPSSRTLRS